MWHHFQCVTKTFGFQYGKTYLGKETISISKHLNLHVLSLMSVINYYFFKDPFEHFKDIESQLQRPSKDRFCWERKKTLDIHKVKFLKALLAEKI